MDNTTTVGAGARIGAAWVGIFVSGITLSNIALVLTIVFTILQIYRLVRTEIRERREALAASAAFAAKITAPAAAVVTPDKST